MRIIDTVEEKQNIAYEILVTFDKLCRNNGLTYVISSGTLLGAVRHKDFISWDDDIDVAMPREDYDRLLRLDIGKVNKHYKIIHKNNTKNIGIAYAKIIDRRTVLREDVAVTYRSGIFMDVIPIDGLPESQSEIERHIRKIEHYKRWMNYRKMKFKKGRNIGTTILKFCALMVARLFFNLTKGVERLDRLARKYPFYQSDKVAMLVLGYGKREVMDRVQYTTLVELPIRDHYFYAPAHYEEFLTSIYGDYMELPPVEKRWGHPGVAYWIK